MFSNSIPGFRVFPDQKAQQDSSAPSLSVFINKLIVTLNFVNNFFSVTYICQTILAPSNVGK